MFKNMNELIDSVERDLQEIEDAKDRTYAKMDYIEFLIRNDFVEYVGGENKESAVSSKEKDDDEVLEDEPLTHADLVEKVKDANLEVVEDESEEVDIEPELESEKEEVEIEDEIEEPEQVTAETEAVVPNEEETSIIDMIDGAEELIVGVNDDGEELDITDAYKYLAKNSTIKDVEELNMLATWITDYNVLLSYKDLDNCEHKIEHGEERAYFAFAMSDVGIDRIEKEIVSMTDGQFKDMYEFLNNETIMAIYNRIYEEE